MRGNVERSSLYGGKANDAFVFACVTDKLVNVVKNKQTNKIKQTEMVVSSSKSQITIKAC